MICEYNVKPFITIHDYICSGCERAVDIGCTHCVQSRAERRSRDFSTTRLTYGDITFSCQRCGGYICYARAKNTRAACVFLTPYKCCFAEHQTCATAIQILYSVESGNTSGSGADAPLGEATRTNRASGSDVQNGSGAALHGEGSEGGEQPVHGEFAALGEVSSVKSSDGCTGSGGAQVQRGGSVSSPERVNSSKSSESSGGDEERDFYARNPSGGVGGRDGDRFRGYFFYNGGGVPELRPSGKHRSGGRFITVGDVHRYVTELQSYGRRDSVYSSFGAHGASGDACGSGGVDGSRDPVGVLRGGAPAPAAEDPALGGGGDGVEARVQEHVQLGGVGDVGLGSSAARGSDELRLVPVVRRCGGEVAQPDAEPGAALCAPSGGRGASVPADREETAAGERRSKRARKERSFLVDEY